MTLAETECDVCGIKIPPKEKDSETGLNLCEECAVDFGKSKVAGCC